MKKILVCISLLTTVLVFAEYKFPGWKVKDINVIDQAKAEAVAQNVPAFTLIQLDLLKAINQKNITTFAALQTEVNTVVDSYVAAGKTKQNTADKKKIRLIKQLSLMGRFNDEVKIAGYEYSKSNPDSYDIAYYRVNYKNITKLTNEQIYTGILTLLKQYPYMNVDNQKLAVKEFIRLCPIVTGINTQKQDLQTLNKIFSPKLIENKAKYEPIVVMIRTALETY